jgi:hypothetical protein
MASSLDGSGPRQKILRIKELSMRRNTLETMTRAELALRMRERGYGDVTERRLSDWQERELLPPFDFVGKGLGQGRGRRASTWSDGLRILEQAEWIYELLSMYGDCQSIYLPLWMLGFAVPIRRVREALMGPLRSAICSIDAQPKTSGDLEDMIDDAASEVSIEMRATGLEILRVPQESLEAFVNILFNQDYQLADVPFQYGIQRLRYYLPQNQELPMIFGNAAFFNQHLSIRIVARALEKCDDDELGIVQRDLVDLCQVATKVWRLMDALYSDMPAEFRPNERELLRMGFELGRFAAYADITLRRAGFGALIEMGLAEIKKSLAEELNEQTLAEAAAASKDFAAGLMRCLENLTQPATTATAEPWTYFGVRL